VVRSHVFYGASGWTDDKNNAVKILASRHDTHDQDLADGINSCLTRDNQAKPTSSFLPAVDNTLSLGSASFRWLLNAQAPALLAQQNSFSMASGSNTQAIAHAAAGTTNFAQLVIRNDATRAVAAGVTSSTYSGAVVVNGPTVKARLSVCLTAAAVDHHEFNGTHSPCVGWLAHQSAGDGGAGEWHAD
jgi:hypothetical protein